MSATDYNEGWEQGEADAARIIAEYDLDTVIDEKRIALEAHDNPKASDHSRGHNDAYLTCLTEHIAREYRKNTNGRTR